MLALLVGRRRLGLGNVVFFGTPLTMTYLLLDIAPVLLIALPMTLVIITGEIDLSVASVVGLSSVLLGVLHHAAACRSRWRRSSPCSPASPAGRSTASSSPTSGSRRWP